MEYKMAEAEAKAWFTDELGEGVGEDTHDIEFMLVELCDEYIKGTKDNGKWDFCFEAPERGEAAELVEKHTNLAKPLTQAAIKAQYVGKLFDERDRFSKVTTAVFDRKFVREGRPVAILLSGSYSPDESGYDVEAVIDMTTGANLVEGHCRPCYSKADALDVAREMVYGY